jgi:hypothetical protein
MEAAALMRISGRQETVNYGEPLSMQVRSFFEPVNSLRSTAVLIYPPCGSRRLGSLAAYFLWQAVFGSDNMASLSNAMKSFSDRTRELMWGKGMDDTIPPFPSVMRNVYS